MGISSTSLGGTTGSLKNKLAQLEDMIRGVNEDIANSQDQCNRMREEKHNLEQQLCNKSLEVRS